MKRLVISPRALSDLDKILDFISTDNPFAARRFVDSLKEKCETLAKFPEIGSLRDDIVPTLRVFSVGNYAIYFRTLDDIVRIDRVLHGAQEEEDVI